MSKRLALAMLGVVMACVAGCSNQQSGEVTTESSGQAEVKAKDRETATAFNEVGVKDSASAGSSGLPPAAELCTTGTWAGWHDKATWAQGELGDLESRAHPGVSAGQGRRGPRGPGGRSG